MSGDAQQEKPGGIRAWLAHAFAIEPYSEDSLAPEERGSLERLAAAIHGRGLGAAAILWIDSQRGLNWFGSQALVMAQPLYEMTKPLLALAMRILGLSRGKETLALSSEEYKLLYSALEKRYSIEYLVQQLEALEAAAPAGRAGRPAAPPPAD